MSFCMQLGYTAVHRAAAQGHTEVIEILTERGCWIDSQDEMVKVFSSS